MMNKQLRELIERHATSVRMFADNTQISLPLSLLAARYRRLIVVSDQFGDLYDVSFKGDGIDYQLLLKKYMDHVGNQEGVTYVSSLPIDKFSRSEIEELEQIDRQP